jgi:putative oxidoreductase
MLALGVLPRLSALALVASMVPTTLAGRAYWSLEDPAARMIGGLLFAVLDRPRRSCF